jgi:hypothetical protein
LKLLSTADGILSSSWTNFSSMVLCRCKKIHPKCFEEPRCKENKVEAIVAGSRAHNTEDPMSKTMQNSSRIPTDVLEMSLPQNKMYSKRWEETWMKKKIGNDLVG